MLGGSVVLNGGAAGSSSSLMLVLAATFLFIFILSFATGRLPTGMDRLSVSWLRTWIRRSLPRITIAVVLLGLFGSLASLGIGGRGSAGSCNTGIPPLTSQTVTGERLRAAIEGISRAREFAASGDGATAALIFSGDTHSVTHDIDRPLRAKDEGLATQICRSVVALEEQRFLQNPVVIEREAAVLSAGLETAEQRLGLGVPESPSQ